MQRSIFICYSHTIELILFCLLWAHFSYWRHFISSYKPLGSQSSIELHRCIFISAEYLFLTMLFWVKRCAFLLVGIWESLEILQRAKESLKSKSNQDHSPLAQLWVRVKFLRPGSICGQMCSWRSLTPLLTALGLLSPSSLTDQGNLPEPFGFVMVLAVQHGFLFWDSRNRYLNIGKKKGSCRQKV